MTKGKAFVLCLAAIMVIFISMFVLGVLNTNLEIIPVGACLAAIGSLAGLYLAGSVANNGVKGKCWNQQMFESENQRHAAG